MNRLQSSPPFHANQSASPHSAAPFNSDEPELLDNAEYRAQNFGPAETPAAVHIGPGHHHVLFTSGCFKGGAETCEEIVGASNVYHDGTRYQRRNARHEVEITGGASGVTWNRCPGLRWIVAGNFCETDRDETGPRVRDCEVVRAPFEELTVVLCINSEPFRGDVLNVRIPWRWLHFRVVAAYFWLRRTFGNRPPADAFANHSSEFKSA